MLRTPAFLLDLAVLSLTAAFAFPAQAQGLFAGSDPLRGLPPPPGHFTHRLLPTIEPERSPLRLNVRPRRTPVIGAEVKKAPPIDRLVNPFPLLLADDTLRYGDVVMFPHGPRVFTGSSGRSHSVSDFEKLVTAGKKVAKNVREALVRMKAGVNSAWREVALGRDGRLKDASAANPYVEKVSSSSFDEELRAERRRAQARTGVVP
jgi:hypothetical protein